MKKDKIIINEISFKDKNGNMQSLVLSKNRITEIKDVSEIRDGEIIANSIMTKEENEKLFKVLGFVPNCIYTKVEEA